MRFKKKVAGLVMALAMAITMIPAVDVKASIFDEMSAAISLEYGENMPQTIDSEDDADWFYFKTNDYAAYYTIQVSNLSDTATGNYWYHNLYYRIYDTDGNCLYTKGAYGKQKSGTEYYKFSPSTTYYLKFYSTYWESSYEYTFKVDCTQEEADTAAAAQKISANKVYTGGIVVSTDEDWYKIVTPKYTMTYSLQVANQSEVGYSNYMGYRVYDDEKTCIFTKESYGKLQYGTENITLAAGETYYLQFYNKSSYNSPYEYTFKLIANDITSLSTPSLSKLSAVSKGFKTSWGAVENATGYQLRYSTKKSMAKAKTVTLTAKSKKVTGLKAKTKYYVQIRAYAKLSNGKKIYSGWSGKSTVTTKK